jgi:predicted transcriptional regulator with HTH domain
MNTQVRNLCTPTLRDRVILFLGVIENRFVHLAEIADSINENLEMVFHVLEGLFSEEMLEMSGNNWRLNERGQEEFTKIWKLKYEGGQEVFVVVKDGKRYLVRDDIHQGAITKLLIHLGLDETKAWHRHSCAVKVCAFVHDVSEL